MIDNVMLLVALVAFAALVVGWMILPDGPRQTAETSMPSVPQAVRAA